MKKEIWFDMDGTLVDFYSVDGWLNSLINEHTKPYRIAKPLYNMRTLGAQLKALQAQGYKVGIISWGAKNSTPEYLERVAQAKKNWLKKHIGAVQWDSIQIVPYGTPKETLGDGILFDDELDNLAAWGLGKAFHPHLINSILSNLLV